MGCCTTKQNNIGKSTTLQYSETVNTNGSVTQDMSSDHEDQQFLEYISKLRLDYKVQRYRSLWFNISEQIYLNQPYMLQTSIYRIYCEITEVNFQKSSFLKFALIAPLTLQFEESSSSFNNFIFVYCKQKREESKRADPIAIRIENNSKNGGFITLTTNLKKTIFINLQLQLKSNNSQ